MWNKFYTSFSSIVVIVAFSIAVLFSFSTAEAQSLWKVNSENPSGSSTGTTTSQDVSNSKTGLYIVLGSVVVGTLLYKIIFEKKGTAEDTTDSNASSSLLIPSHLRLVVKNSREVKYQNPLPVNLYLTIRNDNYNTANEEKTYIVGLSFNF